MKGRLEEGRGWRGLEEIKGGGDGCGSPWYQTALQEAITVIGKLYEVWVIV